MCLWFSFNSETVFNYININGTQNWHFKLQLPKLLLLLCGGGKLLPPSPSLPPPLQNGYWYRAFIKTPSRWGKEMASLALVEISCQFVLPSRDFDELVAVVEHLETRSVVNPKEVALAKREEQKKKQGKANKKKKSKDSRDWVIRNSGF